MRLLGAHHAVADRDAPASVEVEVEPPPPSPAELLGVLPCSARGCRQETGLPCAYIDRRDRRCPTAWCPQHRAVHDGHVFCPVHGRTVAATADGYADHHRPDLDNEVPLLVSWVTRELEPDLGGLVEVVSREYGQVFVADPVRFVLYGVERVRTWERAWKMCAHTGVTLRVHAAVEEADPTTVHVKVNSRVVTSAPAPSPAVRELAEDPTVPRLSQVETFRRALVEGAVHAVIAWRAAHPVPPQAVELTGAAVPPVAQTAQP